MSRKLAAWLIAATATAVAATTTTPAWADPIIDPAPIGPNQYFYGEVNDQAGHATIQMGCFGPIHPGQTGHPLAGQTVKVLPVPPPTTSDLGFTGSAAHAIDVRFPTPTAANTPVILRDYAVSAAIPVSLTLPCYGTGKVALVPNPTSPTTQTATVMVSFIGQP